MAFSPEEVGCELDRYFRDAVVDGTNLGDVLIEFIRNSRKTRELRFQGNGIRGYVEVEFYPATTPFNSFAYLQKPKKNPEDPSEYLKSLVITHVMIEPRGTKQIDEAVCKLFEQTDIEAVSITSIILEEVKEYFVKKGWELYRESDIKLTKEHLSVD
jgi:hypothetical protein